MGKQAFPATVLALGLAFAFPGTPFAHEDAVGDDKKMNQPLPQVDVRDTPVAPDQERLDRDDLSRHRGTGNADVLSAINGVMVNNLRNEAGAVDVGIHGLQGEGRVPVIIDGALQSTHTHRGYQGESDRTYIDMDLVRSISVTKGATFGSAATGAVGGLVQMRTLAAEDVVLPGQTFGVLVRGSLYNNNRTPDHLGDARSQQYYIVRDHLSQDRVNNGAGSLALAGRHDGFDWLVAHSRRRDGNYFAGRHGVARQADHVVNAGQEVVNTGYQSASSLLKVGMDMRHQQRLDFTWRRHDQQADELMSAYFHKNRKDGRGDGRLQDWPPGVESMPQWVPGSARLDSYALSYRYAPAENRLLDLKAAAWKTSVGLQQRNSFFGGAIGAKHGDLFLHRFADMRQGINLSNRALLHEQLFALDFGVSGEEQRLEPIDPVVRPGNFRPAARDARRTSYSTWLTGELDASVATLKLGARLHGASINDYSSRHRNSYRARTDVLGELQVPLAGGVAFYAKAGRTYRNPSLYEASASQEVFSYSKWYPLVPERSDSWSSGLQGKWAAPLIARSTLSAQAGYFSNSVKNYISGGELRETPGSDWWDTIYTMTNYDRFDLSGWEFKLGYDAPAFFAQASATMYDAARVCSRQMARVGSKPEPECNDVGFRMSLVSTRIPPRRNFNLTAGVRLFDARLVLGGRLNYHSAKSNPSGWLSGTGAAGVVMDVPSERILDVFATLRLDRHVEIALNIDNLQNRYAFDPGTVIQKPRPGRTVRLTLTGRY